MRQTFSQYLMLFSLLSLENKIRHLTGLTGEVDNQRQKNHNKGEMQLCNSPQKKKSKTKNKTCTNDRDYGWVHLVSGVSTEGHS